MKTKLILLAIGLAIKILDWKLSGKIEDKAKRKKLMDEALDAIREEDKIKKANRVNAIINDINRMQ